MRVEGAALPTGAVERIDDASPGRRYRAARSMSRMILKWWL